jgi:hypothetical protein
LPAQSESLVQGSSPRSGSHRPQPHSFGPANAPASDPVATGGAALALALAGALAATTGCPASPAGGTATGSGAFGPQAAAAPTATSGTVKNV